MFVYFENEAGVKVNIKQRKMKGSVLTEPLTRGWADRGPGMQPGLPALCNSSVYL